MLSSLRSRLWLSYAFIIITALSLVTMILFVSLYRNPFLYRQVTERLRAVQSVLIQRAREADAPPMSELLERAGRTFDVRILLFSPDRQVLFDSSVNEEAVLPFPERKTIFRTVPIVRDEDGAAWIYSIQKMSDETFLMVAAPRPRFTLVNVFSDEFLPVILMGGGIALLLSLVVAFMFAGWIANPLQRVVNAAREMPSAEAKPLGISGPQEVQELARAFNSMMARVQASQKSQREFVANVSHEMKTPLTSIQGFAQAILDGTADSDEARRQAAQVIFNESERMHRMVLDLLDLAKLDAGTADLKMSPVNIGALLKAVMEKFTPQSQRTGVKIELEVQKDLPPLFADGDRMAQVFTNLVDNALKFTSRGGMVSMKAVLYDNAQMKISVEDTGAGISEEEQARIFQRFYQADPSRRGGEAHGVGLGLAIANEIISAHSGRISVRSRVGEGTSMEVILPLSPPAATNIRKK